MEIEVVGTGCASRKEAALVIDGRVRSTGRIPGVEEIAGSIAQGAGRTDG